MTTITTDWTANLSEQQRAVVNWVRNERGSLNLVARAGCGKTHTLIRGAVRAIVEGNLGEVALMAYNKAAAEEFKERLSKLSTETGNPNFIEWRRVQAGTVHSFGFSAVRRWSPNVTIDDKKMKTLVQRLGRDLGTFTREEPAILKLVSLAKQSAIGFLSAVDDRRTWYDLVEHHGVDDLLDEAEPDELVEMSIAALRASVRLDREVIDFDDMVYAPLVHKLRFWPKDWVLIDEAQDTNAARRCLALAMLKPVTGRLIAVGDDRQAIYGFTGADSDALDLIARKLGSATLPLTVTYRCPHAVVREANRLVPDLTAHPAAIPGEVRQVAEQRETVDGQTFAPWWHFEEPTPADAILCRNVKPLVLTAYGLLADGIGCRVEGREIGEGLVRLATRWKKVRTLTQLLDKLEDYRAREVAKHQARDREDRAQAVDDQVNALKTIAAALLRQDKDQVEDLVAWVRDLFNDSNPNARPNVLTLSTIHKAKGREWARVYLLHRQKTLPSPWARKPWQLRQEENLEYVAITRAQRELVYVD